MASISALSAKLDTLLKRLHSTFTGKLDVDAQAADSALLAGKTAAEVRADVISNELATINGRSGEVAVFNQEGVAMSIKAMPMLKTIRMANDDTAIDGLKAATVSFADVFNSWGRFSHDATLVSPANAGELAGWAYDEPSDTISSTINSATYIGLISKDRFETYNFETILRSNAADDDLIGVVLAYKKIGEVEHTISLLIDGGGVIPGVAGVPNNDVPKATVMIDYPRGSGTVLYQQPLGLIKQVWNTGAELSLGVRLLAKRKIDGTFEIECTKADGSAWPNPIYWTGEIPDIFKSACPIGYSALSQAGATWENIQVPTAKSDIVDKRDTTVWKWNGSAWVNGGQFATDPTALQRGLFYKDTVGFSSYFLDLEGDLYLMGSPGTLS
ncbi:hypothetical protein D9M68_18520 [compost metagenome]